MWDLMVVMETWWPLEATLCSSEKLRCFFFSTFIVRLIVCGGKTNMGSTPAYVGTNDYTSCNCFTTF